MFLGLLRFDIITSISPLECLHCLFVCNLNSNRLRSFIFKLCIMIALTLKVCTGNAGQEQNSVLFCKVKGLKMASFFEKFVLVVNYCFTITRPSKFVRS